MNEIVHLGPRLLYRGDSFIKVSFTESLLALFSAKLSAR